VSGEKQNGRAGGCGGRKEASTRNESVRAHGEEGWCESRCDVKKTRKVENETAISRRRTLRESIGFMRNSRPGCRIKMEII
jgi:hypothetical protein